MTFYPLLFLLLLGHVVGDFYAQTDEMSKERRSPDKSMRKKWLLRHGVCYAVVMAAVLFPVVQFSLRLVVIFLAVSVSHIVFDYAKRFNKWKPFIIDQILHIAMIILLWVIFNDHIKIWAHVVALHSNVFPIISIMPANPYWVLLGILVIIRPVGCLIKSNEIWDFGSIVGPSQDEATDGNVSPNSGRMIGYLERLIVIFLLLSGALGAIGFVITAKAAIRFSEINKETDKAQQRNQVEYFLIGTLLSMVCAFVVYFLIRMAYSA